MTTTHLSHLNAAKSSLRTRLISLEAQFTARKEEIDARIDSLETELSEMTERRSRSKRSRLMTGKYKCWGADDRRAFEEIGKSITALVEDLQRGGGSDCDGGDVVRKISSLLEASSALHMKLEDSSLGDDGIQPMEDDETEARLRRELMELKGQRTTTLEREHAASVVTAARREYAITAEKIREKFSSESKERLTKIDTVLQSIENELAPLLLVNEKFEEVKEDDDNHEPQANEIKSFLNDLYHHRDDPSFIFSPHSGVRYQDLYWLRSQHWISDSIIDFLTARMIPYRSPRDALVRLPTFVFALHVFFRTKPRGRHAPIPDHVQREMTLQMFEKEGYNPDGVWFLPINLGECHWVSAMFVKDTLFWYDSLGFPSQEEKQSTARWFKNCFNRTLAIKSNERADQQDTVSCGAFTILRMRKWLEDEAWINQERVFSEIPQESIRKVRRELCEEIVKELLRKRGREA